MPEKGQFLVCGRRPRRGLSFFVINIGRSTAFSLILRMFATVINREITVMKILNYVKMLVVCTLTTVFASCGDNVTYYTIQNSDDALCSHTWMEEYETTNENGVLVDCVHQFAFSQKNNSGQEIFQYYYTGNDSPYYTETKNFSWKWMDDTKEGLRLDFGANNIVYFENVWVREHYLSGKLDGREVTFTDANYR